MILLSQFFMRRSLSKEEIKELEFPVPSWPYAPVAAIAFMLFIFGVLGWIPETRTSLYVGLAWLALLSIAYFIWIRKPLINNSKSS